MDAKVLIRWVAPLVVATATVSLAQGGSCRVEAVTDLPGSHQFASGFIEAMATDPQVSDADIVWALTADLSSKVPAQDRALYISKTINGGKAWTAVARIDAKYLNAEIGEGERNGLAIAPGGNDFVITTQRGAFQVRRRETPEEATVIPIEGILQAPSNPKLTITKRRGEPVKGGSVLITPDGKHMVISYGYFDRDPHIFAYSKAEDATWVNDGPLPPIPTKMDILSMDFGSGKDGSETLYAGTGDQAFRFAMKTGTWTRIGGVGPDSAIHGMSTVGGLHLAACWGIYNPAGGVTVDRVTHANFLLHRDSDETGPNIRAYSIEVDALRPAHEAITALTGVYTSSDGGKRWRRLNGLPGEEFRSAHFNADGTIIVSGIAGTFVANPFSSACGLRLETRSK